MPRAKFRQRFCENTIAVMDGPWNAQHRPPDPRPLAAARTSVFSWPEFRTPSLILKIKNMFKKILMIIARKNFRDEEYFIPLDIFRNAGMVVTTASSRTGTLFGVLGGEAEATLDIQNVQAEEFDAVVFVGGDGATEYFDNETAHRIVREAYAADKIVAAICIAPVILAKAGILKGGKAVVWQSPLDRTAPKAMEACGCTMGKSHVEQSGNIITADGRDAAEEFARRILATLAERE